MQKEQKTYTKEFKVEAVRLVESSQKSQAQIEVEATLHEEVDRVLAGRLPTSEDLPHLTYTRMIVDETLRLYPAVWLLMRRARQKDTMGGYQIPRHAYVMWSPYLIHRHPDFWENPDLFQPERFRPGSARERQHGMYIPFGAGSRQCIGNHFALMQMVLILAVIAQRYHLELAPDYVVEPAFHATLQSKRNGTNKLWKGFPFRSFGQPSPRDRKLK